MAYPSESDRARIREAVERAEARTSSELVTVIARESDSYLYAPTLAAAIIVLALSGIILVLPLPIRIDAFTLFIGQAIGFVLLAVLFRIPALKLHLVPRGVRRRRAGRHARELFVSLGLHRTKSRAGLLLFVSLAERHVEIIADDGVQAHVEGNAVWEGIVAGFVAQVKRGEVAEGFVSAIGACAGIMAEHFPRGPDDENELPGHLIEI